MINDSVSKPSKHTQTSPLLCSHYLEPFYFGEVGKKGAWGLEGGSQVEKVWVLMLLLLGGPDQDMWVFLCVAHCWKSWMSVALCWNCLQKNLAGEANSSSACTLGCGCFWMLACVWLGLENVWDAQTKQRDLEGGQEMYKDTSRDEISKMQKESHKENRGSICKEDELRSADRSQQTRAWRCNWCGKRSGES